MVQARMELKVDLSAINDTAEWMKNHETQFSYADIIKLQDLMESPRRSLISYVHDGILYVEPGYPVLEILARVSRRNSDGVIL